MKKFFVTSFLVLLFCLSAYSQGLYYIKYKVPSDTVTYEALLGWYGGQDSFMRIRYVVPNTNTSVIVQQRISFINLDPNSYTLFGDNPFFVTTAPAGHSYNSDNLIFERMNSGYFACTKTYDRTSKLLGGVLEFRGLSANEIGTFLPYFGFQIPNNTSYQNSSNSNITMNLIVVADIEDSGIGADVDATAVKREFEIAANTLGLKTNFITLTNSLFNKDSVVNTINNLKLSPNDIVIFVYSGHGFRYGDDTDAFPRFYLVRNRQNPDTNNLQAAQVYNMLKSKGAGLNITIVDSCNTEIRSTKPSYDPGVSLKNADGGVSKAALTKLFLNTKGNIIVAAASKGETSVGNSNQGGVFIRSLMNSFRSETSLINSATPTWTNIITKAREQAYLTPRPNGKQTAVYYIE